MEDNYVWVRIKSWAQMEREYGLITATGSIDCEYRFTAEMEEALPLNRIIQIAKDGTWKTTKFGISNDMVDFIFTSTEPNYKTLVKGF